MLVTQFTSICDCGTVRGRYEMCSGYGSGFLTALPCDSYLYKFLLDPLSSSCCSPWDRNAGFLMIDFNLLPNCFLLSAQIICSEESKVANGGPAPFRWGVISMPWYPVGMDANLSITTRRRLLWQSALADLKLPQHDVSTQTSISNLIQIPVYATLLELLKSLLHEARRRQYQTFMDYFEKMRRSAMTLLCQYWATQDIY